MACPYYYGFSSKFGYNFSLLLWFHILSFRKFKNKLLPIVLEAFTAGSNFYFTTCFRSEDYSYQGFRTSVKIEETIDFLSYAKLSIVDDKTVMEADLEVSVTCVDLQLVRMAFQLALLCTKRHPSECPSMHKVSQVLVSLLSGLIWSLAPSLLKPTTT